MKTDTLLFDKEKEKFEQKYKETNSNLVLTSEIIEIKEL